MQPNLGNNVTSHRRDLPWFLLHAPIIVHYMIQYYTITEGKVQGPPFNITADLKLWYEFDDDPILHRN